MASADEHGGVEVFEVPSLDEDDVQSVVTAQSAGELTAKGQLR